VNKSEALTALAAAGVSETAASACITDVTEMDRGVGLTELADGTAVGVASGRRGRGELVLLTGYTTQALSAMRSEAEIWRYGDGHSARRSWDENKAWAARIGADRREFQAWVHHDQDHLNYAAVCEAAREAGDPWITARENPPGPAREASSGTEPVAAQSAPASAPGATRAVPDRSAAQQAGGSPLMTTLGERTAALQIAKLAASNMNTATLNLGGFTPETSRQRESALAGIAQCNADWAAGELTTSDDMIRQDRDPYWRAGYQIRWLEHAATLPKQPAMNSANADDALTMAPDNGDKTARILAKHGLNTWHAAKAVAEAIQTAGRSPDAAGIKVSEGPGHPLAYNLRIPNAIASPLNLGAGANEFAEEQVGLGLGVAGFVTITQVETGKDFTTITLRLGSDAVARTPAAGDPVLASVVRSGTGDFPSGPRPMAPGRGGDKGRPPSGTRLPMTTPRPLGRGAS
jgi:hypothetical protein